MTKKPHKPKPSSQRVLLHKPEPGFLPVDADWLPLPKFSPRNLRRAASTPRGVFTRSAAWNAASSTSWCSDHRKRRRWSWCHGPWWYHNRGTKSTCRVYSCHKPVFSPGAHDGHVRQSGPVYAHDVSWGSCYNFPRCSSWCSFARYSRIQPLRGGSSTATRAAASPGGNRAGIPTGGPGSRGIELCFK